MRLLRPAAVAGALAGVVTAMAARAPAAVAAKSAAAAAVGVGFAAARVAGFAAATEAQKRDTGTLLYTLNVSTGIAESQALLVHAGDDAVRVALEFCARNAVDREACDQILDHLCAGHVTRLLCRSKKSVLKQEPKVVGSARVEWPAPEQEPSGASCAIAVQLLKHDAEKAFLLGFSDDSATQQRSLLPRQSQVETRSNALVDSLVQLHCTNLARFHSHCECPTLVRQALSRGLIHELDWYRWTQESSHYVTLGVDIDAPLPEIKRAYRRLSKQLHPDRHQPQDQALAGKLIMALNDAYQVLSSSSARQDYDAKLFGKRYVSELKLPDFQAQVAKTFGRAAAVSIDSHGNLKIVL